MQGSIRYGSGDVGELAGAVTCGVSDKDLPGRRYKSTGLCRDISAAQQQRAGEWQER